jgi:hypothetical protein
MDIKYFNLATLFATGLFVILFALGQNEFEKVLIYLISLGVIWGSYFILRKK